MIDNRKIISRVHHWVEKAVIGLDLCPFAGLVYAQNKLRCVVSDSEQVDDLMLDLYRQCQYLIDTPGTDTTLLIIPHQLQDFTDFNQMLDQADALVKTYEWTGVFQIASFHPGYQFNNTSIDDRENWTNRSPFPILHILRESSVERALSGFANPERIVEANIRTLTAIEVTEFEHIFKPDHF